jgi:hypothetical protein
MITRGIVLNPRMYRGAATPPSTTLEDKSRYHNNGTITAATWTQLKSGLWVLSFNGTTAYVAVMDNGGLNIISRPLSIIAWVKPDADATSGYIICRNTDAEANIQYAVLWSTTTVDLYLEGASKSSSANAAAPVSVWSCIGATWSAAGVPQMYVNGVASGAAGAGFTDALTGRTTISIGRRVDAGYFKGLMLPPRVMPVEWSASDWWKAFNSERSLFGI